MATYYDGLNDFYKFNESRPLQSSAQLVYLHLLHENNRLGNSGTFQLSDRELEIRTSLSKNTITEAKRTLKNRGLIDFKTYRNNPNKGTTYTLLFFAEVGQLVGQEVGQTLGQRVGQPSLVPYTAHAKDLRLKTEENEDEARARELKEANKLKEVNARTCEMDVHELWEYETGFKLTGSVAYELETLERTYGRESFHAALIKAVASKDSARLRFNYFKSILEGKKGDKKLERERVDKNQRRNEREYEVPDYSNVPWNDDGSES